MNHGKGKCYVRLEKSRYGKHIAGHREHGQRHTKEAESFHHSMLEAAREPKKYSMAGVDSSL